MYVCGHHLVCRYHRALRLFCYVRFVLLRFRLYAFVEAAAARVFSFFIAFSEYFCTISAFFLSFRIVFFYLVTTGWIFDISLFENSIKQSIIIIKIAEHRYCLVNRVRLPTLLVVSLTRKMNFFLSPFALEDLFSRDGFGRPVPRQPAQSCSRYLWPINYGERTSTITLALGYPVFGPSRRVRAY